MLHAPFASMTYDAGPAGHFMYKRGSRFTPSRTAAIVRPLVARCYERGSLLIAT
jgi:hypothetical protein